MPQAIVKKRTAIIGQEKKTNTKKKEKPTAKKSYLEVESLNTVAADPVVKYMSKDELRRAIDKTKNDMVEAAKAMDFLTAAQLRDEMIKLEEMLNE